MKLRLILFTLLLFIPTMLIANKLYLTKEEKDIVKSFGVIKIGVMSDMPPLEYYGAGYKHQGVISDFLHESIGKLNPLVEYKSDTHKKLEELLVKGEIDLLSYSVKSKSNENDLLFTSPYLELSNAIYTKKNNSIVNHLKDLSNCTVAIKHDNHFIISSLKEKYPNMNLKFVNSTKEALRMLQSGEIETFIGDMMTTDYMANKLDIHDSLKTIYIPWLKTPVSFAISKNKPKLHKLLQKAAESISYDTHNKIVARWFHEKNIYNKLPIFLTKEENQWIQNHPTITVGASGEWRPLSYYENGKLKGVSSGYLDLISQKTGIKFSYQEFEFFTDLLQAMKDKKIDIVDAVAASKTRKEYMIFSDKYLSLENIIAIRKNSKKIAKINELEDKKVGCIEGYIVSNYLKNDIPKAKIVEFKDIKNGLKELSSGKLDAFVLDLPMFDYYTAKYKITNLIVSLSTPYSYPIHFGIKKDEIMLKNIMNKALKTMDDKQHNDIYRKWISVKFAQKTDYVLIWKIVGLFLLFLIIALIWNRSLSREIQKRKEVEKKLIKAKEVAEEATKAKSIFLANMSHEIRTPMNSVIGFAELLDGLIKDPIQRGYLNSIKVGGNALLGIINDILDLSKIEAGKLKITNENIHIYNLLSETKELFYDKIKQKNLKFDIDIQSDIPAYLILDGVRFRQILLNLIGNAIKFTDEGGITLRVKRTFKDENKSKLDLILEVEDTGIGIPEEEMKNVFDDFVQRKKQSLKKYGGTGLGLSICKRLVHAMDGEISLKSEVNKGTTFSVLLKDIGVSALEENKTKELKGKIKFSKATILVVDDIEENRELIKAIFLDSALEVKEAVDGKEAVDMVELGGIDLVLMDLQMPTMDGYASTKTIRQNHKDLPIIALTASAMGDVLEKIESFGFNGYLRKPASKYEIIKKIANFLPATEEMEEAIHEDEKIIFQSEKTKEIFIQKLSGEIFNEWKEVKDKGDLELIKDLNQKIIDLSKVQNISTLERYTKEIALHVETFDLVELFNLLDTYPNLLEKVKNSEVGDV